MKRKLLITAVLSAALAACSSDSIEDTTTHNENYGKVAAQVVAGVGNMTRMSGTTWEAGDSIGVFAIGSDQATTDMTELYTNAKYTFANGSDTSLGSFTAESKDAVYYNNNGEIVTFAAYYPYRADTKNFTIDTRDNSAAGQRKIDILFASGAYGSSASPTLYFTGDREFHHVMSKLSFNIQCSTTDGFASAALPDDAKVYISGLVHDGAIDIYGDAVPHIQDGVKSDYRWDVTDTYRSLIIIPQNLTTTPITIEVIVGGQTYRNNTSITPNMETGTSYTYTITLRKNALEVSGSTIAPWKEGNGGSGDALM
jgi:hypothetical protein